MLGSKINALGRIILRKIKTLGRLFFLTKPQNGSYSFVILEKNYIILYN